MLIYAKIFDTVFICLLPYRWLNAERFWTEVYSAQDIGRGSQSDVVCLQVWLIVPSYKRPKCGGVGAGEFRGLSQWVQLCTWSPNKLYVPKRSFAYEAFLHVRYSFLLISKKVLWFKFTALDFFWAPNGTRLKARGHFTGPKNSMPRAQPPPTCPHNESACPHQNHYVRGRLTHRSIHSYWRSTCNSIFNLCTLTIIRETRWKQNETQPAVNN